MLYFCPQVLILYWLSVSSPLSPSFSLDMMTSKTAGSPPLPNLLLGLCPAVISLGTARRLWNLLATEKVKSHEQGFPSLHTCSPHARPTDVESHTRAPHLVLLTACWPPATAQSVESQSRGSRPGIGTMGSFFPVLPILGMRIKISSRAVVKFWEGQREWVRQWMGK